MMNYVGTQYVMAILSFSVFVRPICLPYADETKERQRTSFDSRNTFSSEDELWVAGWGVTGPRGR